MEVIKPEVSRVKGIVPPAVADYLLNKKRRDIVALEKRRNIIIDIEGDASLLPSESRIESTS
jgi:ribonuclease E